MQDSPTPQNSPSEASGEIELQDKCAEIQALTKLNDPAWKRKFGNEQGLYGLTARLLLEARTDEIERFREAMINHSTPMIYAPDRLAALKSQLKEMK